MEVLFDMRLSWNEIRSRAANFSNEWSDATYERGESQSFYNDFFNIFGVKRRKVASFEEPVKKLGDKRGFIDLFWKGVLLVEQKSGGRDLTKAKEQAFDYFPGLKDVELPRYILLSDFQTFELYDLDEDTEIKFPLHELSKNIEHFGFILGLEKRVFTDQDPVNIKASELMGKLHDKLKESGYEGDDLERLLVRLVFCLFADDTGIFERGIFLDLINQRSSEDGADLGRLLIELFGVLNTAKEKRQKTLDEQLNAFDYINGELFAGYLPTPAFNTKMRQALIEACEFDWGAISPAIFGSLFQSVMKPDERRKVGAHYTTEKNIMKVIEPLFLDELRNQFEVINKKNGAVKKRELQAFHHRLTQLRFFDPACGCGNFLIIAYRELRKLETQILLELFDRDAPVLDVASLSKINVNQFYGIEIGEFPARIAEVALWMMDHIMNVELGQALGIVFTRIPLKASPHIHHGDALELDWQTVLPSSECSYVLGNPPFIGAKMQSSHQRRQLRNIAKLPGNGGTLDYVCAWFLKAGDYVQRGKAEIAFVSTNSITQGEQVAQLWPLLFERYHLDITFAHRTFAWGSDARGMAHVHVVIIGLVKQDFEPAQKRLFSYHDIKGDPTETKHAKLTAYLFDGSNLANHHLVINERKDTINGARRLKTGVQMIDNGLYTFSKLEKIEFLDNEPSAHDLFRKFIGGDEYINGYYRWILYLRDVDPGRLKSLPYVLDLVRKVKDYRSSSKRVTTKKMALQPTILGVDERLSEDFLVIPNTSSERREYIPIGWLTPDVIANQKLRILPNASLSEFAVLTSAMHMAWMRAVTGRMKSDYMYSVGVVYNPFPWPQLDHKARLRLEKLAQAVLDARAAYPDATLADLYDPDLMPPILRKAHNALDKAVDKLYRPTTFNNERERVEHLFALYEKLTDPLLANDKKTKRKIK